MESVSAQSFFHRPSSPALHIKSPQPVHSALAYNHNMNWHESFDTFSYSNPLSSSLHVSGSGAAHDVFSSDPQNASVPAFDPIPSFERDFCSNFTCCGRLLSDLHELVDHFEEAHLLVFDGQGNSVYPHFSAVAPPVGPAAATDAFSVPARDCCAPYSGLVLGYPQQADAPFVPPPPIMPCSSAPPLAVVSPSSIEHAPMPLPTPMEWVDHRRASVDEVSTPEADYYTDSRASSSTPSSPPKTPEALPPSSFIVPPAPPPMVPFFSGPPLTKSPLTKASSTSARPIKSSGHLSSASRSRRSYRPQAASRKREKMYKCPHAGCTKSYLNPNGLKYHLEKGTCKIEPTLDRQQ